MSGNPITWKNVGSTVSPGATSIGDAGKTLMGSFDALGAALEQEKERQATNSQQLRKNRKNEYLGMFENAQTVDELNELRDSGAARAFREAGGFDRDGTFGMYGERLAQLGANQQNQRAADVLSRTIEEEPLQFKANELLQTEGADAAKAFIDANSDGFADVGAEYGKIDQYVQDEWKFENQQRQAQLAEQRNHRESIRFRQTQDEHARLLANRKTQEDAQSLVNTRLSEFGNSPQKTDEFIRGQVADLDIPKTEDGMPDFAAMDESKADAIRRNIDSAMDLANVGPETITNMREQVREELSGIGLSGPELDEEVKRFELNATAMTELSPKDQQVLDTDIAEIENEFAGRMEKLDEWYSGVESDAYKKLGIEDATMEAVNVVADFEGDQINNREGYQRMWGTSNIDQVRNIQDAVQGYRQGTIKIRGQDGIVVPDYVIEAARQYALTDRKNGGLLGGDVSKDFKERVEELVLNPDIANAMDKAEENQRIYKEKQAKLRQDQRKATINTTQSAIDRNNIVNYNMTK